MSFYYSGDQLCYRRDKIEDSNKWTVVDLPYREPKPLPLLSQFIAFLTQSFALVPLQSIELIVDGISLLTLRKNISPNIDLDLPKNLSYYSPDKTLRLKAWSSEAFQITITYMNVTQISEKITGNSLLSFGYRAFSTFVPSSKVPSEETKVTAYLRKITGKLDVNVSSTFAKKMKDTVMKPPPKEAIISMLIESKNEKELSEIKSPLSDYIFPKDFNDAKIFIGFPTKQSTSFKSHIAINQLIPTMERTAVDMSNAYVKDWNKQILTMAGVLCRTVYEHELNQMKSVKVSNELFENASYLMNRFDFQKSAPDQSIGQFIAYGFWKSASYVPIPSQKGILPSTEVRLADDANFIEELAVVPQTVIDSADPFLKRAVNLGYLKKITPKDVATELDRAPLTPQKFTKVVAWCNKTLRKGDLTTSDLQHILQSTIVLNGTSSDGIERLVAVGQIKTYQNVYDIPEDYPLPPNCLPYSLAKLQNAGELESLGWRPLDLIEWLRFAITSKADIEPDKNMFVSPTFAENALERLSRYWNSYATSEQLQIKKLLEYTECIPTQKGMKLPSEAYLEPIQLFPNLPVKTAGLVVSRNFLIDLGVRVSVDVAFVLKRITSSDSGTKWSAQDVIKYLVGVQHNLKPSDWTTLKESRFFESVDGKTYKASELFYPHKDLIALGLPCLKWDFWNDDSPEAKLIYKIGLIHHPDQDTILQYAHDPGFADGKFSKNSDIALEYYLRNFNRNKYSHQIAWNTKSKCVPCVQDGKKVKCKPSECYLNDKVHLFGLPVVNEDVGREAYKLNIRTLPLTSLLVDLLIKSPPIDLKDAARKFSFLSEISGQILSEDKKRLMESKIIPVRKRTNTDEKVITVSALPSNVFFANKENRTSDKSFYDDFFDFVDFPASAKPFLLLVGVREEPSIREIARILVDEPTSMYNLAASDKKYLDLLRKIADEWRIISDDYALVSRMRESRFLLAVKYERNSKNSPDDGQPEKGYYQLSSVQEIILSDDVVFFNVFKYDILTTPPDDRLEAFYKTLGCRSLRNIVEETQSIGPLQANQQTSEEIKKKLLERAFVYLESTRDKALPSALKKLEKLEVKSVSHIVIERRLKFSYWSTSNPIKENISACLSDTDNRGRNIGHNVLYIVPHILDWFDVSQAVIGLMLKNPTPDSSIVLETLLTSNLKKLQRKGYNVNRILKKMEREQEEADKKKTEKLMKQKEATQELVRRQKAEKAEAERNQLMAMNKDPPPYSSVGSNPSNLPSDVKPPIKSLDKDVGKNKPGVDESKALNPIPSSNSGLPQKQKSFFNRFFKPPITPNVQGSQAINKPGTSSNDNSYNLPAPIKPTDPSPILQSGIQKTRAFKEDSTTGPTRATTPAPAPPSDLGCNSDIARNLILSFRLDGGPSIYIGENMTLTEELKQSCLDFKSVLFTLATQVFGVQWESIHIFYDKLTRVIAFNSSGALFFNLAYYEIEKGMIGPYEYWFTVMAHELAHNLASAHGEAHSHWTESYIQNYLGRFGQVCLSNRH